MNMNLLRQYLKTGFRVFLTLVGETGGAQAHSGGDGRQELGIGLEGLPRGNGRGFVGGRRVTHASRLGLFP